MEEAKFQKLLSELRKLQEQEKILFSRAKEAFDNVCITEVTLSKDMSSNLWSSLISSRAKLEAIREDIVWKELDVEDARRRIRDLTHLKHKLFCFVDYTRRFRPLENSIWFAQC